MLLLVVLSHRDTAIRGNMSANCSTVKDLEGYLPWVSGRRGSAKYSYTPAGVCANRDSRQAAGVIFMFASLNIITPGHFSLCKNNYPGDVMYVMNNETAIMVHQCTSAPVRAAT